MPTEPADAELLSRIRTRDEAAFDALLARHRTAVRGRILRIVRDPATADDLVQEVFVRVWTRADQFAGRGSVRGWLMRTATNLALNHLRSARRRRQTPLEARPAEAEDEDLVPAWMIDASTPRPDETAEQDERLALLRQTVGELSREKRDVLRLVHEEDLRLREAAEALGIPEGTVKSRLHHATRDLARLWRRVSDE
jgi:RNA polymerase sigma-70 factor (ECF subfamily)